jgi:acetyl esterase/lipase
VIGSAQLYRWITSRIAVEANAKVCGVNYRLAPQNPFPCAVIDALSVYMKLLEKYSPKNIFIMGDSAGGGLSVSLLLAIRNSKLAQPSGAILWSPWLDLSHSFASFNANANTDFLPRHPPSRNFKGQLHLYAPDADLKNQYVSPIWAPDLGNLCPIFMQTGEAERLLDEDMFFAQRIRAQNGLITMEIYQDMVHVFQIFRFLKLSPVAISRMIEFIKNPRMSVSKMTFVNANGQFVPKPNFGFQSRI